MTEAITRPGFRTCQNAVVMPIVPYGYDHSMKPLGPFWRFIGGVWSKGEPIPDALMVRIVELRDGRWLYQPMQAELQAPFLEPSERHAGMHIFCGRCFPQFAHFIVESLARIWFARRHSDWTLVWTGAEDYLPWQREIMDAIGIRNPARFITAPTELKALAVPSAGHISPTFFAPYYLEALGVIEPRPIEPGKRVYLSRSRGKTGGFVNESAIDAFLADQGWTIFHAEEGPVDQRFDVLSSAETILMTEGAAFTSLLLFRDIRSRIFTLSRDDPQRFSHEPWFADFFGALAGAKRLDYCRLDLPKRHVADLDHNAKYELDIQVFGDLIRRTDSLSTGLEALERYKTRTQPDWSAVRQLAERAVGDVSVETPPVVAHLYRSGLLEAAGELAAASAEAGRAVAARPDSAFALGVHARLSARTGNYQEAEWALARAMSIDQNDLPLYRLQMAAILLHRGNQGRAVEHAKRATELAPANAHCWASLGNALLRGQRLLEAGHALEKAVALEPELVGALYALSAVYAETRDLQRAADLAKQVVGLDGSRAEFHRHLGNLLRALDELGGAERAYRQAIELEPTDEKSLHALQDMQRQVMTPRNGRPLWLRLTRGLLRPITLVRPHLRRGWPR